MAQTKMLKISSDGVPVEMDTANDDITLKSYTVTGGGPVLSGSGLDLNNQDVSDVNDLAFNDPTTGTINQTAGALVVDNIMAKERINLMATTGRIQFQVVTDDADELDSFKLPAIAGAPSATPTSGGEGQMAWDSSDDKLYVWDGAAWKDMSTSTESQSIVNTWTADEALSARDVVYVSAADNVSKALGDSSSKSFAIGLAVATVADTDPVGVKSDGIMPGFTGLTAGSRYYLDASTAGAITATVPTGAGNTIVQIGYAKSATALHIQIAQLGRRAA